MSGTRRRALAAGLLAGALAGAPAGAAQTVITAVDGPDALAAAVAAAASGDRIVVRGGEHRGPIVIGVPLELLGEGAPVVDGGGRATVIAVGAPDVTVRGLTIRGSGLSLDQENSGIAADDAPRLRVLDNRLEGVLFGIYLRRSPGATVEGNHILGAALDAPRRGDAIRVWYSDDVTLRDNEITGARDVVLWYSKRLEVLGNRVTGGRYGLHFMYCDDAAIRGNLLQGNSVGAFLMYSRRLRLAHNTIAGNHGPSGYGVGLKDMDDAELLDNQLVGNRVGVYLDNSPRDQGSTTLLVGNLLAANDIGISLLPNVERATFEGNSLVENRQQVEIAGGGGDPAANLWRGNHWSDYVGFDADSDGRGDLPYRSERLFEDLADRHPALRLFVASPATRALDLASRAFPIVRPQPRLEDLEPRLAATRPAGCPPLERPAGVPLAPIGGGLALAALALLSSPRLALRVAGTSGRGGRGARAAPARRREPAGEDGSDDPPTDAEPLVSVRGVTREFGRLRALDDVSFEIRPGESVALWGPNGAGKTTALRAVLGLLPVAGRVRLAGLDPRRHGSRARRHVGFVPQEVSLQADLRVAEILELHARLRRVPRERIPRIASAVGLEGRDRQRVGELSGGLRQRLAVGLALLSDPPLLILDEPTANLDAAARSDLVALVRRLHRQGKTLLFSSHRPGEVLALAGRVLRLEAGRLVEDGEPGEVLLDGREAELWLRIADSQFEAAGRALEESGWAPRAMGRHWVVVVASQHKARPLEHLVTRGISVLDFELEVSERPSGTRGRG